jgi:hypothetical protein
MIFLNIVVVSSGLDFLEVGSPQQLLAGNVSQILNL